MNRLFQLVICSALYSVCASPVKAETLVGIYELSRNNDPRILSAEYERQAAALDIPIARAKRRPNISFILDRDFEYDSSLGNDNEEGRFEAGLNLSMPIYNRQNNVGVNISHVATQEAENSYFFAEQTLFLRTAELYFNALRAVDNVGIAKAGRDAFKSQVELATELAAERLIARSDVKEAQASLDSANASIIEAENQLLASREALRVAIGSHPGKLAPLRQSVTLVPPSPNEVDHWVNLASEQNPSVVRARLGLERAELEAEFARSDHYPTVRLESYVTQTYSDRQANDNQQNGEIAFKLNVPLYAGGSVKARVAQAKLRGEFAKQQTLFAERSVEEQVRNAFANVNASIGRAQAFERAVQSNEASLDGIEAGVKERTRTIVDLLDVTNRLIRAQFDFTAARYDYILNQLALKSFTGELSLSDLSEVDDWLVIN